MLARGLLAQHTTASARHRTNAPRTWHEGAGKDADQQRRQDGLQQAAQQRQRRQRHARRAAPKQRRQHELHVRTRNFEGTRCQREQDFYKDVHVMWCPAAFWMMAAWLAAINIHTGMVKMPPRFVIMTRSSASAVLPPTACIAVEARCHWLPGIHRAFSGWGLAAMEAYQTDEVVCQYASSSIHEWISRQHEGDAAGHCGRHAAEHSQL